MNSEIYWYTSRATGIVAYALLAGSMAWGVSHSIRLFKQPRPPWMLDMHRFLSGLAVIFTLIHVVALLFHEYKGGYAIVDLLIPFSGTTELARDTALPAALGIVAFYLLLAVEGTSLVMKRLPRKVWKSIHYLSYALFIFATIHTLLAGTDVANRAMQLFVLACCAVNLFVVIVRIASPKRDPKPERSSSGV